MVDTKDAERSVYVDTLSYRQIFDRACKSAQFFDRKREGVVCSALPALRSRERLKIFPKNPDLVSEAQSTG